MNIPVLIMGDDVAHALNFLDGSKYDSVAVYLKETRENFVKVVEELTAKKRKLINPANQTKLVASCSCIAFIDTTIKAIYSRYIEEV